MSMFGRRKATLKMGIVGLPNVGKSSLFNLLCKQSVPAENYPFCTIEPNEARCMVPNDKFDFLCRLWKPKASISASLHVTDIAGLIKGASKGLGLGNSFLSHIQAVDGIFHVIRAFEDGRINHVEGTTNPIRDIDIINSELCKKDFEVIQTSSRNNKTAVVDRLLHLTESEIPLWSATWSPEDVAFINENFPTLLTTKPSAYLLNVSKADYVDGKTERWTRPFEEHLREKYRREILPSSIIPVSVEHEQDLESFRDDPELAALMAEGGELDMTSSALPDITRCGFETLHLINFFTVGEKEVRSWTLYEGQKAPSAAGRIHSDFERNFQKADVVSFQDFQAYWESSGRVVRFIGEGKPDLGPKVRSEGKSYTVQDGDIIVFKVTGVRK